MAKAAPVNPFAAAAKKPTAAAKKSAANVYVADQFADVNGTIHSKQEVADAIGNYCQGHEMFETGKAMKDTNRPVVVSFARGKYAMDWLLTGKRPSTPKVTNADTGDGAFISVVHMDNSAKLDEDQFNTMATLLGNDVAEANVIRRNDFLINPELLDQEVTVKAKDGKSNVQMTVMEAIAEALQDKFGPSPDILAGLFQAIPKFETKKGLIDKGLQLVAPDKTPASAARLIRFLEVIRCTTQLKPGSTGAAS